MLLPTGLDLVENGWVINGRRNAQLITINKITQCAAQNFAGSCFGQALHDNGLPKCGDRPDFFPNQRNQFRMT